LVRSHSRGLQCTPLSRRTRRGASRRPRAARAPMTRRSLLALLTTLATELVALGARAEPSALNTSDEARVALVWIFGDDDATNPPDASEPPSPAASIGDRTGYDALVSGYRSRYTGRENRVELRLHGSAPGFVPSLT